MTQGDHKIHLAIGLNLAAQEPDPTGGDPAGGAYWEGLLARIDSKADLLTLADGFGAQTAGHDAVILANRLGPLAQSIGILAGAAINWQEPFHISTAIATLDYVTRGRAGLLVEDAPDQAARQAVGALKGFPAAPADLAQDRRDALTVIRALWDSWQEDTVIRDTATQRFIDGAKLHYVGFKGAGFSVLGPSITPRPPQGHPVIAAQAETAEAIALAAENADLLFLSAPALLPAARTSGPRIWLDLHIGDSAPSGAAHFRPGDDLAPLIARIQSWAQEGLAGLRLLPQRLGPDLTFVTDSLVPALIHAGLWQQPHPDTRLRDRLGLAPAPHPHSRVA